MPRAGRRRGLQGSREALVAGPDCPDAVFAADPLRDCGNLGKCRGGLRWRGHPPNLTDLLTRQEPITDLSHVRLVTSQVNSAHRRAAKNSFKMSAASSSEMPP